ncbi:MAG: hypothetical protein WDM85_15570 [Caulobacteraceae bacterium]
MLTDWMDASVGHEFDPTRTDPALDPFNPDNGPPYSAAFIARYRAAQRARNQRITDWAKAELARVNAARRPRHPVPALPHLGRLALHGRRDRPVGPAVPRLLSRLPRGREQAPGIGAANSARTGCRCGAWRTSKCQGRRPAGQDRPAGAVVQSTGDMGCFRATRAACSKRWRRRTRRWR